MSREKVKVEEEEKEGELLAREREGFAFLMHRCLVDDDDDVRSRPPLYLSLSF